MRKSPLRDRAKLEDAVRSTDSISDALKFLGLRAAGGNFKSFHQSCLEFGITPKDGKLKAVQVLNSSAHRRRMVLDKVLVEGSSVARTHLKKRLIVDGLLEDVCSDCGISIWNGKKLSLHLDHINGVYNDNRLENLRLLCPNCHSLTATYSGKKGNAR